MTIVKIFITLLSPCLILGPSSAQSVILPRAPYPLASAIFEQEAISARGETEPSASPRALNRLSTILLDQMATRLLMGIALLFAPSIQAQIPMTPPEKIERPVKRVSPEALAETLSALPSDTIISVSRLFEISFEGWLLKSIDVEIPGVVSTPVTVEFPGADVVKPNQSTMGSYFHSARPDPRRHAYRTDRGEGPSGVV